LEKDALAFKRDVLTTTNTTGRRSGSDENMTGTVTGTGTTSIIKSDKILRHFQSKALQLESAKDKLKLQQIEQKKKLHKLEMKIQQKDNSESNFHYIDFHKLQAENKKFKKEFLNLKSIELEKVKISNEKSEKRMIELNDELDEIKKERLNVEKSLDLRKRHLQRLQDKVEKNKSNIQLIEDDQKGQTENDFMDIETTSTSTHTDIEENGNSTEVEIMDIVDQQTHIYELKSLIKTWRRKVEIAHLAKKNKRITTS
jgi:chromosome segregation ATPase